MTGNNDKKLSQLKRRRAVLIEQQERVKEFFDNEGTDASEPALRLRLNSLEEQMRQFNVVQGEIESLDDEELKSNQRSAFEETYFHLQPSLTVLINKHIGNRATQTIQTEAENSRSKVRLPEISLPSFNGSVSQWSDYFETFKVLIHEERSLTKLQKFQYLKSTLTGPASAQIASLEINDDNYDVALDLLKNKYDNKKLIVQAHLQTLLSIKPLLHTRPDSIRAVVDQTNVQLRALEALGRPAKHWDDLLVHLIVQKLDAPLRASWEDKAPETNLPTLQDLLTFLNRKCDKIEAAKSVSINNPQSNVIKLRKTSMFTSKSQQCSICKKAKHFAYRCPLFLQMTVSDRVAKAQELKLCPNCLKTHTVSDCKSTRTCQTCNGQHHSLIHSNYNPVVHPSTSKVSCHQTCAHSTDSGTPSSYVFIATAIVNVIDDGGNSFPCRAVLDSGSQLNFISERLVQQLRLRKERLLTMINSIGDNVPMSSKYQARPSTFVDTGAWRIPNNIELSDPEFYKPHRVDLLIGAELYFDLLQVGQIRLADNLPTLQKTILGWIVSGKAAYPQRSEYSCHMVTSAALGNESLASILKAFWEVENHEVTSVKSKEEQLCEEHYLHNYKRNESGRFIVKLPFRENPNCLGNTLEMATRRFLNLERRLHKNPHLFVQYKNFINEYEVLWHMRELKDTERSSAKYFIPHHCVLKPESSTTKLRVVFDASAKSTPSLSLNDILMVGAVVQQDLFSIILRFRTHRIAITADISKMYRQVLIDPNDCVFQNLVWRENPSSKLRLYQLQTVTYGTSAAPFLATRTLLQLALEGSKQFPIASEVMKRDFYVDDFISGCETLEEAKEIKMQLESILRSGGFDLRKWCSNSTEFLSDIPINCQEELIHFQESDVVKTLGLIWEPQTDHFNFKINLMEVKHQKLTKRSILADVARIFDPLGLISPVVILGKMFLQQLWKLKLDWDESLPMEIHTSWSRYRKQLLELQSFKIPRRLHNLDGLLNVQLHAFSDASERAYGSCLYLRCVDKYGNITVNIICSKSRVTPINQITIPRLELCAALLMAQLVQRVRASLNISIDNVFYWTDSQIVLSWLAEPSSNWCTFVANRVATIQHLTDVNSWRFIEGKTNPADMISRGLLPRELIASTRWIHGPTFLQETHSFWTTEPSQLRGDDTTPERRHQRSVLLLSEETDIVASSKFINSLTKLQHVFAHILRFIKNTRLPQSSRIYENIGVSESEAALKVIIKIVQQTAFKQDYRSLLADSKVLKGSRLSCLNPFLDDQGVIRVGGRLRNAKIPYDAKHPMLLPSRHAF